MAHVSVKGQMGTGAGTQPGATRQALSRVRPSGVRRRDLERLSIGIWPDHLFLSDVSSRVKTTALLRAICQRLRKLGLANSHAYCLALHEATLRALDMERRELAIITGQTEDVVYVD